jgi:hypothetical protein
MRTRFTVAAVTGALALSAFAVPAAQAAGTSSPNHDTVAQIAQAARHLSSGPSAYTGSDGVPYELDLTFSNTKVNNGKPIVAGTSNTVSAPVTFTVTHAAKVDIKADDFAMVVVLYRGSLDDPEAEMLVGNGLPTCTVVTSTKATCKSTIDVYPDIELTNADAGSWKAGGLAIDFNGEDPEDPNIDMGKVGYASQGGLATVKLQRFSKLTVNAAPEPVKKGKTVTVTGRLTRANWDTAKYAGYSGQSVKLQYRKKSATTYTTLKTVKTSSTGTLSTTTKATADGYYRFSFAGTSTTPAVSATGDYVDVK